MFEARGGVLEHVPRIMGKPHFRPKLVSRDPMNLFSCAGQCEGAGSGVAPWPKSLGEVTDILGIARSGGQRNTYHRSTSMLVLTTPMVLHAVSGPFLMKGSLWKGSC